jgi:hypothetical protein
MNVATTVMLDAALEYARREIPIFPVWWVAKDGCGCGPRCEDKPGKHPIGDLVPHGVKDATTDVAKISAWWTRFPKANLATPTSWCAVLDVDPRHGGDATLAELERQHGPLPDTAEVLTGGAGRHLYFAAVPGLAPRNGIAPGLDMKSGAGAYVLLPPSSHVSGGTYLDEIMSPLFETPLAPMPAWLLALAGPSSAATNGHPPAAQDWGTLIAGVPEGQRREIALKIAGHYLGKRLPETEVVSILRGFAVQCAPPFSERECREIVRDLARRDRGKVSVSATVPSAAISGDALGLVSIGEILSEPDEEHAWIVDQRLPAGGLGLFAGKPKSGKSTNARCLALSVARGNPWLGHATTQGAVIYLALEEKRAEVRDHFRALGAAAEDPIFVLCASAPSDALERLRREAERLHPVLIIIDPLFRFVRVEDGNDYAIMTAALEPLLVLARETGAHVLLVHHLGKGERNDGDSVLGSTAIFGAVDTALLMKRSARYRTLLSIQRYGEDLEETVVTLDPDTREVSRGGTRDEAEQADAARLILGFLAGTSSPVTEAELADAVEARTRVQRAALRALVVAGHVDRSGRGGKSDPFRYSAGTRTPEGASE